MRVTAAYFQNTLLPGAKAADVGRTLTEWHATQGYQPVQGRLLFNYRDFHLGPCVFLLSNEKWCVVLHSSALEEAANLRRAFAQFPAVVQLWAQGGAWGYRLEERGRRVTAYCSKAVEELPGEPPARQRSDVERLVAACGVPNALARLRRLEGARFLFVEKACAKFAEALEAPLAVSNFFDVDQINAGMAEERRARGWTCQMLAFEKAPGAPPDPVPSLWPGTVTPEQRAEFIRRAQERRRPTRWLRVLPAMVAELPRVFLFMAEILLGISLALLSHIPGLRPLLLGKATLFRDGFWAELQPAEPKRIQIKGDLALNTRHDCSVRAASPAQVLEKFKGRKPIPGNEPVFDIKLDGFFVSCMARPASRRLTTTGGNILEQRPLSAAEHSIDFTKRLIGTGEHRYYLHEWTVHATRADYQFACWDTRQLAPSELEVLENLVRSFRVCRI